MAQKNLRFCTHILFLLIPTTNINIHTVSASNNLPCLFCSHPHLCREGRGPRPLSLFRWQCGEGTCHPAVHTRLWSSLYAETFGKTRNTQYPPENPNLPGEWVGYRLDSSAVRLASKLSMFVLVHLHFFPLSNLKLTNSYATWMLF